MIYDKNCSPTMTFPYCSNVFLFRVVQQSSCAMTINYTNYILCLACRYSASKTSLIFRICEFESQRWVLLQVQLTLPTAGEKKGYQSGLTTSRGVFNAVYVLWLVARGACTEVKEHRDLLPAAV